MVSKSDPTVSSQFKAREDSTIADAFPFICANHSSGIFRANSQAPSPTKTLSMHSMSTNSSPLEYRRRHRSFSEVIRSSSRPIAENDEADSNGGEKRMCGLFRRRQQKRPLTNAKDVAIMRDKIDQLHMMMRASLETSEKLRKRLAMISRYYEGIIKKLQEQMVEIKTEKARLKAEIDSKISAMDHEQRTAIMQLENKLRQRDEEIRILTEKLNAPRCEI
jgi:superfamily I DNA and RNA helicase